MQTRISGLHHVTAIARDPQRNLDFYVGLLGLRFDPDSMMLELVASPKRAAIEFVEESSVPKEHSLRGLHGVSAIRAQIEETLPPLTPPTKAAHE